MDHSLDNESRAGVPIAVVTSTLTIATTAVCLRTYTRSRIVHSFGMDDWSAIIALLLALGSGLAVAINTIYGAGHHIWTIDPSTVIKYFRTFYISIVLYNGSLTATKMTFLLQYYRVFGTQRTKKVIIFALIFVAMWSVSQLLIVIFNCSPIDKFWKPDVDGTCIPNLPFWYINAAGNIVTDVTIFVIPLPVLGRLKLRRSQKYLLMCIFSLGFFTCAISIIRIHYLHLSSDVTWDNVGSSCWSITELSSGITCACLPTLRPLLSQCVPALGSHAGRSGKSYQTTSSGADTVEKHDYDNSRNGSVGQRPLLFQGPRISDPELQRSESEDLSDGVMGLANTRQYSNIGGRMQAPWDESALRGTVQTEIRAGTPKPPERALRRNDGGIAVERDVKVTKERH